jgi:hypothetical protein
MKMKSIFGLAILFLLPVFMHAQETEKKFTVTWGGFVRNDIIFNTRELVSARGENIFSLVPTPIVEDDAGSDINANPNFNMSAIATRLSAKITGPDAFGAKTSGVIEADFLGFNTTTKSAFRLRHAMIKFDWGKNILMTGQYWHPLFVTDCYPGTVSFNTGVPFNPLARVPQLRYVRKLKESLSVETGFMAQGMYTSVAPTASAQRSAMPEVNVQLKFKNEKIAAGAGVNYLVLKPSLTNTGVDTAGNPTTYVSDATVSGLSFLGYLKMKTTPITVSLYGIYGQNTSNVINMGGYAVVYDTTYTQAQIEQGYVEYIPTTTMSTWLDLSTNGKKVQFGLFAGYTQNMGAAEEIDNATFSGRWGNVNSIMRVSPRVVFLSEKTKIGFEIEYQTIDYAKGDPLGTTTEAITGIDDHGVVTGFETANNIKALLSFSYLF